MRLYAKCTCEVICMLLCVHVCAPGVHTNGMVRCFCVFGHCYPKPLNGRYITFTRTLSILLILSSGICFCAPQTPPSPPPLSAFQKDSKWYCDMHTYYRASAICCCCRFFHCNTIFNVNINYEAHGMSKPFTLQQYNWLILLEKCADMVTLTAWLSRILLDALQSNIQINFTCAFLKEKEYFNNHWNW